MSWRYKALKVYNDELWHGDTSYIGWHICEQFEQGHTGPVHVFGETKEELLEVLIMMYNDIAKEIEYGTESI